MVDVGMCGQCVECVVLNGVQVVYVLGNVFVDVGIVGCGDW